MVGGIPHEFGRQHGQQICSRDDTDDGQKRCQIECGFALYIMVGEGAVHQLLGKEELLGAAERGYSVALLNIGLEIQMRANPRMIRCGYAAKLRREQVRDEKILG